MTKKSLFRSFLFLPGVLIAWSLQAQVNLKSVSIGASYWKPSLDYWNKRSILTAYNNGQGATLSGGIMPTVALELGIVSGLSIGGRVGYWKNSAAGPLSLGGNDRTEKLTLSIIPVSLDLKYAFVKTKADNSANGQSSESPSLIPYVGVSVARYFISNEFSRQVASGDGSVNETQAGNTYGVQVYAGAEKKLAGKLYAALDVRYHVSSYNQVVTETTGTTVEKVSLNGLEAGLSLRVKFN